MKHLILLMCLLWPFTSVNAGWFSKTPDPIPEYKEKIIALENKLNAQSITLNRWQIATGSLAVGCAFLLIIGAALGAKTRHHYDSTRRLGPTRSTPPPSTLNGRKSTILGEEAEESNVHSLAA